jgi:hypothetical protein
MDTGSRAGRASKSGSVRLCRGVRGERRLQASREYAVRLVLTPAVPVGYEVRVQLRFRGRDGKRVQRLGEYVRVADLLR